MLVQTSGTVERATRLRAPLPDAPPTSVLDELVVLWRDEEQAELFESLLRDNMDENLKQRLAYLMERNLVKKFMPSTGWCVQLVEHRRHMCWTPGTFGPDDPAYKKTFVYSIGARALYGTPNVLVIFDEDDIAFSSLFRPQDLGAMVNDLVSGLRYMPAEKLAGALEAEGVEVNDVLDHTKPRVTSQAGSFGRQKLTRVSAAETTKYLGYLRWFTVNFLDSYDVGDTLVLHLGVPHVPPEMRPHAAMHHAERAFDLMMMGAIDRADAAFRAVTAIAAASPPGAEVLLVDLARLHSGMLVQAERWDDALAVQEPGLAAQKDGALEVGSAYTMLLALRAKALAGKGDTEASVAVWRDYKAALASLRPGDEAAQYAGECAAALK